MFRTFVVLSMMAVAALLATAPGASAAKKPSCAKLGAGPAYMKIHPAQKCRLWLTQVPVYASKNVVPTKQKQIGTVTPPRFWFVGQEQGTTVMRSGNKTNWWAYTLTNGGRWGWVPGVYFSDSVNNQPISGLLECFHLPQYKDFCQPNP